MKLITMSLTQDHWSKEDLEALDKAESYADLFNVAKSVVMRMTKPVGQVCGPITTGGSSAVRQNIEHITEIINSLEKQGVEIFNQVPFQSRMQKIREAKGVVGYDRALLDEFYLPIFEAGLIQELYFLPGWEKSEGSRWEHEQAKRLGIKIAYL